MSRFSGKCDLYDSVVMIGGYDVKDIELYLNKGERSYPLKITEARDLIPYYPYVPGMSVYSDGKYKAWISESFIDSEERELLESDLYWLKREWRKCKRKGIEFNPDNSWYDKQLIARVKELGEKATIKGIHKNLSNHWRKALAKEMEQNGYKDNEIVQWVYPERWLTKFDWRNDNY